MPPDLIITGFISTPEIEGVDEIELNDHTNYRLVTGTGEGGLVHERRRAKSPFTHGGTLTGIKKDIGQLTLVVCVYGDTMNDFEANKSLLFRALADQFRYRIGLTINGEATEWFCEPGDMEGNSGGIDKIGLMQPRPHQVYTWSIPRDPIPIQGVF